MALEKALGVAEGDQGIVRQKLQVQQAVEEENRESENGDGKSDPPARRIPADGRRGGPQGETPLCL
jgi:hypothetical protein